MGLTGRPGRLDAWCGVELAAAGVVLGSLLPSGSPLRSAASRVPHTHLQILAFPLALGLRFTTINAAMLTARDFLREISGSSTSP